MTRDQLQGLQLLGGFLAGSSVLGLLVNQTVRFTYSAKFAMPLQVLTKPIIPSLRREKLIITPHQEFSFLFILQTGHLRR